MVVFIVGFFSRLESRFHHQSRNMFILCDYHRLFVVPLLVINAILSCLGGRICGLSICGVVRFFSRANGLVCGFFYARILGPDRWIIRVGLLIGNWNLLISFFGIISLNQRVLHNHNNQIHL